MARQSKEQRLQLERSIWFYRQKGWTHDEIAQELGFERSYITKILKRVSDRVVAEMYEQIEREKYEQIILLQNIMREAMEAWENSAKPKRTMRTKRVRYEKIQGGERVEVAPPQEDDEGNPLLTTEEVVTGENREGDPRYLQIALQSLSDIRKILGLDKVTTVEVDWRAELIRAGINVNEVFESLVIQFEARITESSTADYPRLDGSNSDPKNIIDLQAKG